MAFFESAMKMFTPFYPVSPDASCHGADGGESWRICRPRSTCCKAGSSRSPKRSNRSVIKMVAYRANAADQVLARLYWRVRDVIVCSRSMFWRLGWRRWINERRAMMKAFLCAGVALFLSSRRPWLPGLSRWMMKLVPRHLKWVMAPDFDPPPPNAISSKGGRYKIV